MRRARVGYIREFRIIAMPDEIHDEEAESLRLPRNWHTSVRSAVLNVIGIVRIAMLTGRETLIKNGDSPDAQSISWNPKWRCCGKSCVSSVRACGKFRPIGDRSTPAWSVWQSCNCGPCVAGTKPKRVVTSWSPTIRSETGCAESTMTHSCKPHPRSIGFRMSCVTPSNRSSSSARRSAS